MSGTWHYVAYVKLGPTQLVRKEDRKAANVVLPKYDETFHGLNKVRKVRDKGDVRSRTGAYMKVKLAL